MKKWIPSAHSLNLSSQKFGSHTVSPFLYIKAPSCSLTAHLSSLLSFMLRISITFALSQRHFLPVALLLFASSGISSFTRTASPHPSIAFFQPMKAPSDGHAIGIIQSSIQVPVMYVNPMSVPVMSLHLRNA